MMVFALTVDSAVRDSNDLDEVMKPSESWAKAPFAPCPPISNSDAR